jgi:hypothetical protein
MGLQPQGLGKSLRNLSTGVSAIPSSAIHRWKLDGVGTGTATDSIGSADGTVSGVSSISSADYQGGAAGDGDGTDDEIPTTTLGSFGGNHGSGIAIAFTIDNFSRSSTTATDDWLMGVFGTGASGNTDFQISLNQSNVGDIQWRTADSNSDSWKFSTDSGHIADGNLHRILINSEPNAISDIYVADKNDSSYTQVSTSVGTNQSPFSWEDFTDDWALFNATGLSRHTNCVLDDVILYSDTLNSSGRSNDLSLQPSFG